MKIAIPMTNGLLSAHFGHCEQFVLFDVAPNGKDIQDKQLLTPPRHEPGVLPRWLHGQNVDVVITGGMGPKAQNLFEQNNIKVVTGAPNEAPEKIARQYVDGILQLGANACDH